MSNDDVKLGVRVKDTVTGFEGIVSVVSDHLYGCSRIGVTPEVEEGATNSGDVEFFDEPRLEVLDDGIREEWLEKRGELEAERPTEAVAPGPSDDPRPPAEDSR